MFSFASSLRACDRDKLGFVGALSLSLYFSLFLELPRIYDVECKLSNGEAALEEISCRAYFPDLTPPVRMEGE